MTVSVTGAGFELIGDCPSEEAEPLLAYLLANPGGPVVWRDCDWAHTAIVQVLLAAGVQPVGPARGAFLSDLLEPLLKRR